ncbi:MAG: DUF6495 family protein, partial [Bacteroidota bacterium]
NSITKDEWSRTKQDQPDAAEKLIELFSDIFWDKVLDNLAWAQVRAPKDFRVFQVKDKWEMIHLRIKDDCPFDLTKSEHISAIGGGAVDISALGLEIFTGTKPLKKDRKTELFEMLEAGAQPCTEAMWLGWQSMVQNAKGATTNS